MPSTASLTIGNIADFCRARDTGALMAYSKNSPSSVAWAVAMPPCSNASGAGGGGGGAAGGGSALRACCLSAPDRGRASVPPPGASARCFARPASWRRASLSASPGASIACPYTCGRRAAYTSGTTTGRWAYRGSYMSMVNEIGRPEMRDKPTSCQSSSVVFSTRAQPCKKGGSVSDSTRR